MLKIGTVKWQGKCLCDLPFDPSGFCRPSSITRVLGLAGLAFTLLVANPAFLSGALAPSRINLNVAPNHSTSGHGQATPITSLAGFGTAVAKKPCPPILPGKPTQTSEKTNYL